MTDSIAPRPEGIVSDCPFCVELSDVEASDFRRMFSRDELVSRTVAEDSEFALIIGIGAFRPGYLLLIPKVHASCFAQLPQSHSSHADGWRRLSLNMLNEHFGDAVLFEHGGTSTNMAGGCIDHAHIHLVPSAVDVMSGMDDRMPYARVRDLAELPSIAAGRPYVLVEQGKDMRAYFPRDRLPSQYMRRLLLELEGQPDLWDWAVFPGRENMLTTAHVLSTDSKVAD
ncbi:hypothetical protein GCM10022225_27130 [Plantactinospora mayteni]|uniref:HIT domain-containing protein n=1 Tax=Plantactinospora mayteni TaxID=566021 RepID=A0ABQ4EII4_9ACTN|nr:hypothetical protein [Plantactinospora mayteni]GIG94557.1 hypothetical protein Pma05_11300 [Plantactinospora mayteni]